MMARLRKPWTESVGGYGHRVIVFERRVGGPLYLRWWDDTVAPAGNWRWKGLQHTDRQRALAQARELSGQVLAATSGMHRGVLTVGALFTRYEQERSSHKKGDQPREDRRRMDLWQTFLASDRDVRTLDFPTLDRFVRERRAGRIVVEGHKFRRAPGDTGIGADIVLLQSVLNWACNAFAPDGARLLDTNPVRGYETPRNKNVKRPVATYDRFLTVRAKADAVDPQRLFGSFLDLIEALGWRVSAICALRASDIDRKATATRPNGRILKRGETDKEGVEMWVPLSADARAAVERIFEINPVIGAMPLFPARKALAGDRPASWSRYHARSLLRRAEKVAGIDALEGGDFHPYRRAWATARKHLPAQDVAAAGGWRDLRSLEQCYQQTDEVTMLAVVSESRKVRQVNGDG